MELKDLFLTPIFLIIIYAIAYGLRSKFTNKQTRKYFIPALTLKIIGALSLGLIYQFYYGGGDTFNYYNSSKIVTQAFYDNPSIGIKILLSNGEYDPETIQYTSKIYWYQSPTEFIIIKIGALFGIIGLNTYSVIAIFFATSSFAGIWALYTTFLKIYPALYKQLAIPCFFLPSVFFWGSGFMKDSVTIGALGLLFYGFYMSFIEKKKLFSSITLTILATYLLLSVKVYILLSFLPPALFWIFLENNNRIKNKLIRTIAKPVFIVFGLLVAYIGATTLTAGDERYDIEKIGERTKINSEYLSEYVSSGSAYNIGTFDGSIGSMITVAPQAIIVALYRPFLWEVRNPIMLLSALEASMFIFLTLRIIFRTGFWKTVQLISSKPILTFCIIFSLVFAFGVGTNSGNFGTLVRYKIPLMPFYLAALYMMQAHLKRPRKLRRLAVTA
ncbi:hypothetical protein ACD591_15625 [Rufibacter glacialis]|uniref:Glycosyltransferase RgtA/B/C/D-like domain-containing protein n=1 Tax=Rufibacter glacialis TaxID=1259555 RepID=A0A5M8QQR6_9BACT|nr:hypothetical protein [Rufibacter glacialis]KAA6437618.1 hypothetical protein FOE74_03715 [Rufibacter glacialis]